MKNYITLFKDPNFLRSLRVTVLWSLCSTFFSVLFGWLIALLAGLNPNRSNIFRLAIFMAYGIPAAASGIMLLGIFQTDLGLLNGILDSIGLSQWTNPWLGDKRTAIWVLITCFVWIQTGLPLLTCYAAIRGIPVQLFEASYIDGAGPRDIFRFLMIPFSLPGVQVSIFINLLNSLKSFDIIYVMTGGGPLRSTETIGFFMYQETVSFFKLGYGSASVVVMTLFVCLLSIPVLKERSKAI
ncbi:MAG: sugar ABC transporter permease [Spirochaetales bacterium]|nr:sugar ABC transporter permease [Spirochaetales bacterium]